MNRSAGTPTVPSASPAEDVEPADQAKGLFEDHVPMSLIMDLNPPNGPHSRDILDAEGSPTASWWQSP